MVRTAAVSQEVKKKKKKKMQRKKGGWKDRVPLLKMNDLKLYKCSPSSAVVILCDKCRADIQVCTWPGRDSNKKHCTGNNYTQVNLVGHQYPIQRKLSTFIELY